MCAESEKVNNFIDKILEICVYFIENPLFSFVDLRRHYLKWQTQFGYSQKLKVNFLHWKKNYIITVDRLYVYLQHIFDGRELVSSSLHASKNKTQKKEPQKNCM